MKSPLLISTLLFLLCTFGANPAQAGLIKRQECDPEAGCKVNFTPPPAVIANAIPAGAPKLIKRQAEECDPEAGCKRPEEYDPPPAIIAKAVDAAPLDQLPEVQSAAEELPLETELIGLVKKLMRRHTSRLARRDPQYYQPKQQQQPPLQPAQPAQCPAPPAQQQPKANEPPKQEQPKANQPPKQTAPMPPKNNNNMPEQKKQEQPKADNKMPEQKKQEQPKADNKMPEQKKQEQPKADNKMPEQKKQEQPKNAYQAPNQEAPKQQVPPMKNNQPPKQQVPPMKDNQPPQQPQPKDVKEQPKQKAPEQPQGVYQPPPPPAKKEDQKAQVDPKKEDPKKADPKQAVDAKQPGQKAGDAKGGDVKGAAQDSLQIFNTFCDNAGLGKALGDGTQKKTQTCSRTIQGAIPSFDRMVSTIITSPNAGATVAAKKALKVEVRTNNLDLGFFEDPNARYYQTPQTLNGQGIIEGHQHITVQRLTGVGQNVNAPPDARTEALAFFKGLDDDSQNGILSVEIPAENLAQPGIYRLCTITGTRGHQPVLMPVARRGSQDDCIRITVQ